MTDINPYQILGIPTNSTIDAVKEAYRQLATKHHPDKGGNPETFKIVKLAFKMIVDNIKKGIQIPQNSSSTYTEMKEASQNYQPTKYQSPQEFFGRDQPIDPNREFDRNTFNQKFMQNVKNDDDYVLSKTTEDYREKRTKEQLLAEQQSVDNDLSNIKPIFSGKDFNRNVFNRLFEQVNGAPGEKKDLQIYEEPMALTSGMQPYTEIDSGQKVKQTDKLSSLGFGDISEVFGQKAPNQFDHEMISKLATQPDITDVSTLEPDYHNKIKQRLNEYQNTQMNFHPKPSDPSKLPDQIRPTNATTDKISQQGLNDAYNRKMQERNGLINEIKYGQPMPTPSTISHQPHPQPQPQLQNPTQLQQHRSLPVMEYPRNSNEPATQPVTDYFVKIPSARQMDPYTQQNNFYQPMQPQPQMMGQIPSQMMGQVPNQMMGQISNQMMGQIPNQMMGQFLNQPPRQLPEFHKQSSAEMEQIQQQLQDLKKTVLKQKKIIRTLATKK